MLTKKLLMILIALSLVLGAVAIPAVSPAMAATCTQFHTVRRGETLFSIGLAYGVSWPELARINNIARPRLIFAGQRLCVSTTGTTRPRTPSTIPTFSILGVERDRTVTIQTANFPANDVFTVTMGPMGSRGVGGTYVETVSSRQGGTRTWTFNIPAALAGSRRIAIRLESPTSGYFAFNWFWNNTAGGGTGGATTPGGGTTRYRGFPTFSIVSVVRNNMVTIRGNNFPPNDRFVVTMGKMGTRGVGGIRVDTFNSGAGGNFTATFAVPAALAGSRQIAIRLESPTSGYFAYNWFWNNTTP